MRRPQSRPYLTSIWALPASLPCLLLTPQKLANVTKGATDHAAESGDGALAVRDRCPDARPAAPRRDDRRPRGLVQAPLADLPLAGRPLLHGPGDVAGDGPL